jgi:hypothetical protein
MASIRNRNGKWQARNSRKGELSLVKTFQSKEVAKLLGKKHYPNPSA